MADPVPFLLEVEPRLGIDAVVGKIQGYTAHTIGKQYPWLKSRLPSLWTRWRLMASVGAVSLEVVKQDIEEQKGK
jgi:putative transposase